MTRARVLAAVVGLSALALLAGPKVLAAARLAGQKQDAPQEPSASPPTIFRTGVETVAIYATALDAYGEMVLRTSDAMISRCSTTASGRR